MKTILLAAAAVIAMPAIAQTQTTPTTTPTPDQSGTMQNGQTMPAQSPQADPSAPMPGQQPMAGQSTMPTNADPAQAGANGMAMPGQPTFQQPRSVNEAFPPPPAQTGPLPYCKAGQYDGCREHSTASGKRSHKTPR